MIAMKPVIVLVVGKIELSSDDAVILLRIKFVKSAEWQTMTIKTINHNQKILSYSVDNCTDILCDESSWAYNLLSSLNSDAKHTEGQPKKFVLHTSIDGFWYERDDNIGEEDIYLEQITSNKNPPALLRNRFHTVQPHHTTPNRQNEATSKKSI